MTAALVPKLLWDLIEPRLPSPKPRGRVAGAADAVAWRPLVGRYTVCRWGAVRHWLAV